MLDRVIAWQRQRQKNKDKDKKTKTKKNKDQDGHLFTMLDRVITWTVAGLRLAHRHHLLLALLLEFHLKFYLLWEELGFLEKIWDFVPTRGGGRSFAIGTFGEKKIPNQLLSAHLYFSTVLKLLTSTVVAATACFSSMYSIRQISACSTTEEELIKMKNLTSQSKAAFKQELSKQSFNLISFQL